MAYRLQDTITIRLDGGRIANEDEHDVGKLERTERGNFGAGNFGARTYGGVASEQPISN